ncbi:MAG TPA: DUF99 family protein, partial [Candidatus Methanomethylicus sp.]|nr:DUF99 family protein [Candidatus Methanomethylicus sp.]
MHLRRVLAVGGGAVRPGGGQVPMALLLTRGTVPEHLCIRDVEADGTDATPRIIEFIRSCADGIDALMARSVPIAGFNYIDAGAVLRECGIPSVFVLCEEPDMEAVGGALRRHFADWEVRLRAIEGAGPVHRLRDAGDGGEGGEGGEEGEGEEDKEGRDGEALFIECVGIGVS